MSSSQNTAVMSCSSNRKAASAAPSNVNGASTDGGVPPRREAMRSRRRSNVGASKLEARWPIREWPSAKQVVERRVDAGLDVQADDRQAAGAHLDLDRVLGGARREVGLEEQQAVGGAGQQRLQGGGLPGAVVAEVDEHDGVARALGGALGAAQDAAEERVRDVGHDERDAAGDAGAQRAGGDVRAVAELGGGGADGFLGARGDATAGLAGQDERNGRLGNTGTARDVDAGDAWRSADVRHPRAVDDLVEEVVGIAGRDLALLRPRDAEALLSEEAFEHEEYLPYWAELWPSALALARAVGSRALRGARTLELGCGLGLPSLAAVRGRRPRTATDWAPDAIAMTLRNAERNGIELEAFTASWTEPEGARRARALGFRDRLRRALRSPQRRSAAAAAPAADRRRGEIWLADPGRPAAGPFLERAPRGVRRSTRAAAPEIPQGGVHRLRLKGSRA